MDEKPRVLILCTGNSARSQMAKAIVNHDLGGRWQAFSAGTRPAGFVHPAALQVLAEIGIGHVFREVRDGIRSKVIPYLAEKC